MVGVIFLVRFFLLWRSPNLIIFFLVGVVDIFDELNRIYVIRMFYCFLAENCRPKRLVGVISFEPLVGSHSNLMRWFSLKHF